MRIAVSRAPGGERVVTPLELFFDLVYVFAIGQLSHPARARRPAHGRGDGDHGARGRLRAG
jgi:low temperature requirement protein LtrA